MPPPKPVYLETSETGRLREKISRARRLLANCTLCPRECGVDRLSGETGICRTGEQAMVSSYSPHFGEEAPLVGRNGSGTIFFTHCNLLCNFCQNYDISHEGVGRRVSDTELANMMLQLQNLGCQNVNFVTPSHVVPQILSALEEAIKGGLSVPLVYNTSGYDAVDTLKLLEGVVDVYMPDFKFWASGIAADTCEAPDYPEVAREAVKEMHRQVGDLDTGESGLAARGLIIRHLVLPGDLAGTNEVMRFVAQKISPHSYVNIMPQYRPCGTAHETRGLSSRITGEDFASAVAAAVRQGIRRIDR